MKMKYLCVAGIFLFYSYCGVLYAGPEVELTEPVWDLGSIGKGEVLQRVIEIKNTGDDILIVQKARASCDCISLEILEKKAEPGGFVEIKAVFDANKDVKNVFKKYIYVQTNDKNRPVVRMTVKGVIDGSAAKKAGMIKVVLFYSPGCRGCRQIKDVFLRRVADKYNVEIENYDITVMDNYLKLMDYEEQYGVEENDPMIIFAGDRYFSGKDAILNELEPYIKIKGKTEEQIAAKADKGSLLARFKSFSPFVIISAGLIDGINPCAFVTIIFLVSFLFFIEKQRKEILLVGLVFSFSVFLTYLFIGMGLFKLLYKLTLFSIVSDIIYTAAICLVFVLAFYSFYDAFVYLKTGTAKDVRLQLPKVIKNKIHSIIRNNLGNGGLFISVLIIGFLVSLLESVCTGQVYVPTIMYMVKDPSVKNVAFSYLIMYNLAFIAPLIVVMLAVLIGVSSERFVALGKKNTFVAKLLLAGLFFGLGVLLIII